MNKKYGKEVHEIFGHEKGCDCYDCMKETARRMYSELASRSNLSTDL